MMTRTIIRATFVPSVGFARPALTPRRCSLPFSRVGVMRMRGRAGRACFGLGSGGGGGGGGGAATCRGGGKRTTGVRASVPRLSATRRAACMACAAVVT
jgi:hypothetical protein